jgi:uncharacterized surface protein with fasciclin (FAS1) repeats
VHVVEISNRFAYYRNSCSCKSNFTSLVGALTGAGQPDFVTILSGTGPFTVFAPTNAAFGFKYGLAPGGIAFLPLI